MNVSFASLGLAPELLKAVEAMGFEEPSPIQTLAIPVLLERRDVIGQARTGTGKTAAFALPLLHNLDMRVRHPQGLVLCPTRELAIQVAEEMTRLAACLRGVTILPIYGGQPIDRQLRALARKPQIIVGTPGRVLDHLQRGSLRLDEVSAAVLDEADEMLDMGFREDMETILGHTGQDCQRVLFSATMPAPILELAGRFLHDPKTLKLEHKELTVPAVEQWYYEVRPHQKKEALCRLLDARAFGKALVFCSTKRSADEVALHLQTRGYQADALHGDLAQTQRDRVMDRFRNGGIEVLAATDVAARGLDVDDVDAVVNYDIPHDVEGYVHRIGRTGRAGRAGQAFTFVTAREHYKLRDIGRYTKARISRDQLPTLRDVDNMRSVRLLEEVRGAMENGALERYASLVDDFLDGKETGLLMAAALLKLLMQRDYGRQEDKEDTLLESGTFRPAAFDTDRPRGGSTLTREKGRRDSGGTFRHTRDMAWLRFNVGSEKGVAARDLVGAIAGETGLPSRIIGAIEVREQCAFVEIPHDLAGDVMDVMNGGVKIRGLAVSVEKADAKGEGPLLPARHGRPRRIPSVGKKTFRPEKKH